MEEKIVNWQKREKLRWQRYRKDCPLKIEELRRASGYSVNALASICGLGERQACCFEKCPFGHWKDYK
jgi:hypothetical protein